MEKFKNNNDKENSLNSVTNLDKFEDNKKYSQIKIPQIKHLISLFLKTYSIRIIYSIFLYLKSKGNKANRLSGLIAAVFNMSNLRTSLTVTSLPLFFDICKKIIFTIFKFFKAENKSDAIIFLSGFISSYLSICFEEKSQLGNYIILGIMVRVFHSWMSIEIKDNDQYNGTGWGLFKFLIAGSLMIFTNFLNPSFQPITSLFDAYANFLNRNEKAQMNRAREIFRIV